MLARRFAIILLSALLLAACATPKTNGTPAMAQPVENQSTLPSPPEATTTSAETDAQPVSEDETMTFELTSPAFAPGAAIPKKYTCKGDDISPPLSWGDPPARTKSLALIMDDPDAPAGTWVHWILFNIPADQRSLEENLLITAQKQDSGTISVGSNSWKRAAYGGPCPPSGTHRYFFKLYALDTTINLPAGATKQELLDAMQGHILAQTELMGTFSK